MLRSIETDYDIAYHKRAIAKCLEDIDQHLKMLRAVDYEPSEETYEIRLRAWSWDVEYDDT